MKIAFTLLILLISSSYIIAMQPKKNLNCDHARVASSYLKIYSIQCPHGQAPYTSNAIPNPACYSTTQKNINTGLVHYKVICASNDNGSFPKPFVKK